jgi:hypothetical protein
MTIVEIPMSGQFVSVTDAAVALGFCQAKAYYMVRSGEIPSMRVGHFRYVPLAAVKQLQALQRIPAGKSKKRA